MIVIDASVILAMLFREPRYELCLEHFEVDKTNLMSTVNLTEVLIVIQDKLPEEYPALCRDLQRIPLEYIPVTLPQAELAAKARADFPLNLGDCFAYALAKELNCPMLTLDSEFLKTDLEVIHPHR